MKMSNKGTVALGSLTATVALLAGLSNASAQSAPGAGSFPQSFLIPGTNTSLSIYGVIKSSWRDNFGAQHDSDAGAPVGTSVAFHIAQLALQGPGASGGNSIATQQNSIHGGFRGNAKPSTLTFETRTPSSLGEIKTVLAMDMNLFPNQANYIGATTSTTKPSAGSGNTEGPRLLWSYATIGPWLIGQYNTNFADPTLFPDVSDSGFNPGFMNTANIRQPQIRYTYLAGSGLSLSAALEYHEGGTMYVSPGTVATAVMTSAAISSFVSDNTDIGGIVNLPNFNAGVNWDQPWGHLMGRVGVSRNEVRNTSGGTAILGPASSNNNGANNIKKWGWAIAAGGYLNTWGQDQWKFQATYSDGASNYSTDLSATGAGNMFCNGFTGTCKLIDEFAVATSYTHRFNPNWRSTAAFGIGFFGKPSNATGLTNVASGTTAAQLASLERRHLSSQLNVVYSPLPGITDIYLEWDHWDRWVQASNTHGWSQAFSVGFNIFW
jgi:hypothetical protein